MVSYGGIPLTFTSANGWAWPEVSGISLREVLEFAAVDWPGRWLSGWPPVRASVGEQAIRLGSLIWPPDASKFAVAHYLATDGQLAKIRALVYDADDDYLPQTLLLDDETNSIETEMWMLPPRPLGRPPGSNEGYHVVTLVDERFFFWQRSSTVYISEGGTSWENLFMAIGAALGITIEVDTIDAAYLSPAAGLMGSYEYLPPLLDAAAAAVGQRIVRSLSGVVSSQNVTTALASQEAQWGKWPRQSGGAYRFVAGA
jgi:hypothetical protein